MRIASLGYRPIGQTGQNCKNNNTIQYNTPIFKGQIIIKNAEGSILEKLIEKTQRLLQFYNRNAASNAKHDYSLGHNGRKIEVDVETPFKIIREGNALKFLRQPPSPIQGIDISHWYDKVAIRTKDVLNKALLNDARKKGQELSTVPQLEFIPD